MVEIMIGIKIPNQAKANPCQGIKKLMMGLQNESSKGSRKPHFY
jgi:hypothetical protein